jgi:hypothetical protein
MLVRVIDYTIDDGRENPTHPGTYRLSTTVLDPAEAHRDRPRSRVTPNGGRSRSPSMSSRPTYAVPAQCCARSPPTWSSKRSGAICAATTRSARSWPRPPPIPDVTRTASASSPHYGSSGKPSPTRPPFPLTTTTKTALPVACPQPGHRPRRHPAAAGCQYPHRTVRDPGLEDHPVMGRDRYRRPSHPTRRADVHGPASRRPHDRRQRRTPVDDLRPRTVAHVIEQAAQATN